jgi:NAD(P)-dependent dehydrogenase (short-subunit alcohol dehydrogenase family)
MPSWNECGTGASAVDSRQIARNAATFRVVRHWSRLKGMYATANEVVSGHDLTGMNVIVTGGTSGLGAETARVLAAAGARVVAAGRSRGTAELPASAEFEELDLASLKSVDAFVRRWNRPLHLLVNNAGVMRTPFGRTVDGFELQFGTNHLGHFALTTGLLPALRDVGGARVVVLSSRGHRRSDVNFDDPNYLHRPYDPWEAYGQSKTANCLFAVGLTRRGMSANAVAPGAIQTSLMRHMPQQELAERGWLDTAGNRVNGPGPEWKTIEQGAATTVWAAVAPELQGVGGKYLDNCAIAEPWTGPGEVPFGFYVPYALDPDHAERLWDLSEKLTAR